MNISIRKLTTKDLPKVIKILNVALKEDFTHYQPRTILAYSALSDLRYYRRILKRKTSIALGAFNKNSLLGFISLENKDGGVGFIEWFVVKKSHRDRSIGMSLMEALEREAFKKHYHYVFLYTETQKNIVFYKKRGFEYVGLQRNSWFGEDEHLMQKILREKPFEEIFEKYLKKKV